MSMPTLAVLQQMLPGREQRLFGIIQSFVFLRSFMANPTLPQMPREVIALRELEAGTSTPARPSEKLMINPS